MTTMEELYAAAAKREQEAAESALTVQQLIDLLQTVDDKSRRVWADGCDCSNPVIDWRVRESDNVFVLEVDAP